MSDVDDYVVPHDVATSALAIRRALAFLHASPGSTPDEHDAIYDEHARPAMDALDWLVTFASAMDKVAGERWNELCKVIDKLQSVGHERDTLREHVAVLRQACSAIAGPRFGTYVPSERLVEYEGMAAEALRATEVKA